ncbi:MAG TPA: SRPBCC domain-containing protein [Chitinophagales bacterium]|nr:SRPBCC domain-containing protein [Chitinophagales bacterium]HNA58614.1 SRPBCC domain-containing protein [Chitinophagales bacterium]HNF68889.1 SRPBCC domain-containing protein [Chitinophagales bacterium]HNJ89911.1 SRPBCC domain-containing protein [Chitinophagales bacterium]HNK99371.1 SRPBCC domain-containing protein [Chitinophagales bacterium]
MADNLPLELTIDKASKTVTITRAFNASQDMVWDAFTRSEFLDQWNAPKPFTARTKYMDFSVGGKRFYAMVSPDGQERWILQTYLVINPKTHFKYFNVFADANENPDQFGSEWDISFSEQAGLTTVQISIFNESLERLERMLELGFKEGYAASMANLEALLENMQ